ncbi:MAG: slipin family protein [Rubricoccaceae bacterium]
MGLFFRRFDVPPGSTGLLFRDNQRVRELAPGVYRQLDPIRRLSVVTVSTAPQLFPVHSQEALTQDAIAFRFTYSVRYAIDNAELALQQIDLGRLEVYQTPDMLVQSLVHAYVQAAVKDRVATLTSEQITDDRASIGDLGTPELDAQMTALGVRLIDIVLRDVTFPKAIQGLFSKRLEAKIRAQSDLENARTTVAAARALKNASAMLEGDQTVLFLQFMETLTKIADKGNHTFHIGEMPTLPAPKE